MLTVSNKKVKRIGNLVSGLVIAIIIAGVIIYMKANGANFK